MEKYVFIFNQCKFLWICFFPQTKSLHLFKFSLLSWNQKNTEKRELHLTFLLTTSKYLTTSGQGLKYNTKMNRLHFRLYLKINNMLLRINTVPSKWILWYFNVSVFFGNYKLSLNVSEHVIGCLSLLSCHGLETCPGWPPPRVTAGHRHKLPVTRKGEVGKDGWVNEFLSNIKNIRSSGLLSLCCRVRKVSRPGTLITVEVNSVSDWAVELQLPT